MEDAGLDSHKRTFAKNEVTEKLPCSVKTETDLVNYGITSGSYARNSIDEILKSITISGML